jgi:diphthamide synthase subunit DPH2
MFIDAANRAAIDQARRAKKVGLILGTLGRQGSPSVLTVSYQICLVVVAHSVL